MVNNNGFNTRYNVFPSQNQIFNQDPVNIGLQSMIPQFNGFIT